MCVSFLPTLYIQLCPISEISVFTLIFGLGCSRDRKTWCISVGERGIQNIYFFRRYFIAMYCSFYLCTVQEKSKTEASHHWGFYLPKKLSLSRHANIDKEIARRLAKASVSFGSLREKVWEKSGISVTTKLQVYKVVVLPSLLYGCETWTVYAKHAKNLTPSTCVAYVASYTLSGRTKSLTLRYLKRRRLKVSSFFWKNLS